MPFSDAELVQYSIRKGDLLVVEGGAVGVNAFVDEDITGVGFQKTVNRVRPRGDASAKYVGYVLDALRVSGALDTLANKSTIAHLTAEKLERLRIPLPPSSIQRRIADYLDSEIGRVDAFVSEQELLIKLLRERLIATVVDETATGDVTRVPFWTRFRRVKRSATGDEELLSVYRDYGVIRKSDRDDNFNRPADDLSTYQLVRPADLVINKMKAWQGSVAISALTGIVSPAYFVYERIGDDYPAYLHYLLRSYPMIGRYHAISKGVRPNQWDLDPDALRTLPLALPPLLKQKEAVARLDREISQIDAAIADANQSIALSNERRIALISSAVTGMIDVQ